MQIRTISPALLAQYQSRVGELFIMQYQEHNVPADPIRVTDSVARIVNNKDIGFILGAFDGDQLIGIGYVSFVWPVGDAWLEDIFVLPSRRSEGIGGVMLRECIQYARAFGARTLDLEVYASQNRANSFYEREGFVPFASNRWEYKLATSIDSFRKVSGGT